MPGIFLISEETTATCTVENMEQIQLWRLPFKTSKQILFVDILILIAKFSKSVHQ
jgi:hypothetical protein